jgi:hypothetical protein
MLRKAESIVILSLDTAVIGGLAIFLAGFLSGLACGFRSAFAPPAAGQ